MSEGVLGIDIGNVDTGIVFYSDKEGVRFPTVICKDQFSDEWYVGEEAYSKVITGSGELIERILEFAINDSKINIYGKLYSGKEIIKQYFKKIIEKYKKKDMDYPKIICCAVDNLDKQHVDLITNCFLELGYLSDNIYVISKQEAFIYYIRSNKKELWNNRVGLFYSYENTIKYYELMVDRYAKYEVVRVDGVEESGFVEDIIVKNCDEKKQCMKKGDLEKIEKIDKQLDILDNILHAFEEENIGSKIFSSIFFTGKAFNDRSWAKKSIDLIKGRGALFYESNLFALGACYRGYDLSKEEPFFKFVCICNGRINTDIFITVDNKGKKQEYLLVKAGDLIYKAQKKLRVMVSDSKELRFEFRHIGKNKNIRYYDIPIDFMPQRPNFATRIDVSTSFTSDNVFYIELEDAGFGDIYKKTKECISREVLLWQ